MKKYIFSLILILNIANLFAYDQQAYKELLAGGKKFENADLSKAKIKNMDLSDVAFINVNLSGAFFHNSMLTNVTFDSCNLSKATYCDVVFNNSKILNNSNLTYCIFAKVIFDSSEISNSFMPNAKLLETDFMISRFCNINMDSSEFDTVNFSGCTLENINFRAAKLELVKIYETVQIGKGLIFDQTSFSRCCLLGINEKSSVIGTNFFGTIFKNSYFLNLNFDSCTNLDQVSWATKSLFSNISSTNPKDLEAFAKKLKANGAKVNGEWITDKEYWDKFDTHYCKKFFANLWPSLAYLVAFTAVGSFCPPLAPVAGATASSAAAGVGH